MARPPRDQAPGTFHVTNRGAGPCPIFTDDLDDEIFVAQLAATLKRTGLICRAFCLLSTHYHLLISAPEGGLAAAMQHLNGRYGQWFNRRHGRSGHLFQGRYGSVRVERQAHLLELVRYLALNPVRAGLCTRPEDWRWSSYGATIGRAPLPAFLGVDSVLELFAAERARAVERLKIFVAATDGV
jgi:putative transposase